jgi:hypothetical protein
MTNDFMPLVVFTLIIMAAVGYAYLREGLFTGFAMFFNVFFGGLIAFNFFEPLADMLEPVLKNSFLKGYEDFFCLIILFSLTTGALRTLTNALANAQITFPEMLQRGGGVVFGLATGYLTCGFLVCALQTLPWHENFMSFDPDYQESAGLRRVLPPDRVWLGLMYRAGAFSFANQEDGKPISSDIQGMDRNYYQYYTFDKSGSFELRYRRYRRWGDNRDAYTYMKDLDDEIHRRKK